MLRLIFATLITAVFSLAHGADKASFFGIVETVQSTNDGRVLSITGTVRNPEEKTLIRAFRVAAGALQVEVENSETAGGSALNRPNDGKFAFDALLEKPIKNGLTEVKVTAHLLNGDQVPLLNAQGSPLYIYQKTIYGRHWALLSFFALVGVFTFTRRFWRISSDASSWTQNHTAKIAAGIILIFGILVSLGVTGSSLRILLEGPFGGASIEAIGSDSRIFKLRPDRGDEWGVLTPNVLAQLHHTPPFPIQNTHIGLDGQNMGVIGMTGVPINQWAALARPATWGYFFLPLRQAQAWQWQLPFWGCLITLWALLNFLKPGLSGRNLALSFLFCAAPYAAAWSNWPLYATAFPALALTMAMALSTARTSLKGISLGLGLGYALSAWFLVLYPPWIISVGTLCALLYIGWVLDRRRIIQLGKPQILGLTAALAIPMFLLGSWWQDTHVAIGTLQETVYPGQRTTITGGDNSFLWFFRGYTNLEAVTFGTGPWTNQPEISSYLWLPLASLWLCLWGVFRKHENRWTVLCISAFACFYVCFVFVGIPTWLAELSQWGRIPTNRGDLSLGLAFIFLICLTSQEWFSGRAPKFLTLLKSPYLYLALTATAWITYKHLTEMPIYVFPKNDGAYVATAILITVLSSWWLLKGKASGAITILLCAFLASSVGFNPVSRAPRKIQISEEVKALASDADGTLMRTLVVGGEGIGPHSLAAVGVPIVNGVLYYPHRTLWQRLELADEYWPVVNRYQHLGFSTGLPKQGGSYSVQSPVMDQVSVTINPEDFDFSRTGALRVAALESQAVHLRKSPMLKEIGSHKNLVWFAVDQNYQK